MLFPKDDLLDMLNDDGPDTYKLIRNKREDTRRWVSRYRIVFQYNNKFYESYYEVGLTEQQETYPYDRDPDLIDCNEVFRTEKTVVIVDYVTKL